MLKINLVFLGHFKVFIDKKKIKQFKSSVFEISNVSEILNISNAESFPYLEFSDNKLRNEVNSKISSTQNTINVLVCWLPLEGNWYARILGENLTVLSLYETGDILLSNHISIENFIIKNILELTAIYYYLGERIREAGYELPHDQTRKCLFDMNYDKGDIIFNTNSPQLCNSCSSKFDAANLPENFKKKLEKDLKKLKKEFFYRVYDFVESHPKISIFIATFFALIINVISNYLYDLIKINEHKP